MSGTNSANRILAILDVFTEDRLEWTPDELMALLGYSRPTVYRYVKSLKEAGLLISMPGGGLTLGPRVVEMDFLMQRSDPLICCGEPLLDDLVEQFSCSALLVRWYGEKLLCVASRCSTLNPLSSYPRGRPMPLRRGAISRAILAFLPRRQLEPLVRANISEWISLGFSESVEDVLEMMRNVRREGYATAKGEVTPGVLGVAAPVFHNSAVPVAAICVTIEEAKATGRKLDQIITEVRIAGEHLSAKLTNSAASAAAEPPLKVNQKSFA